MDQNQGNKLFFAKNRQNIWNFIFISLYLRLTKMMFYFSSSLSTNKTDIDWENRRKFQKIVFEVFSFCFLPNRGQDSEKRNKGTNLLFNI